MANLYNIKEDLCKSFLGKEPRDYLGCSIIGHPCDRLLWYNYKGIAAPPVNMKTEEGISKTLKKFLRFELGHLLEELLIKLLNKSGFHISNQQEKIEFLNGKLKGHIDGIIQESFEIFPLFSNTGPNAIGEIFTFPVLEIKSMNDQRFKLLQKKNVKEGFPEYWAQCQLYMKGMGKGETLFLAINKNTCEIYQEFIHYDEKSVEGFLLKAQRIFEYESEPSIFTQPGRKVPLVCSGCDYFDHCYKETIPNETKHDISA